MKTMKTKLLKTIFACTLFVSVWMSSFFSNNVDAKEKSSNAQIIASYNLEIGGVQTFHTTDLDGNEVFITIEKLEDNSRISNGSYKVTYEHTLFWKAGFSISISNNKITSIYSPFYSVIWGSISSPTLTLNTNTRATLKFIHKAGLLSTTTGVIATISGTELNVSRL